MSILSDSHDVVFMYYFDIAIFPQLHAKHVIQIHVLSQCKLTLVQKVHTTQGQISTIEKPPWVKFLRWTNTRVEY